MTLYLRKDSDDVLSFCKCAAEDALVAHPGQLDCPWCGCGFLFSCWKCRKAFTFATAIETELSLEEIVERDYESFMGDARNKPEVRMLRLDMRRRNIELMIRGIELGGRYVYLDGFAHRVGAFPPAFTGVYGHHSLDAVPQLRAGANADTLQEDLDQAYWLSARDTKRLIESRS